VISLFLVSASPSFLMIGIVPSFKPVFESLEVELPGLTVFIMDMRVLHARLLVPVVGGIAAMFFRLQDSPVRRAAPS